MVTEADSVLCFVPFTERKQGISGKLFITNFKLTFLTGDRSSYEKVDQPLYGIWKFVSFNQLLSTHDFMKWKLFHMDESLKHTMEYMN